MNSDLTVVSANLNSYSPITRTYTYDERIKTAASFLNAYDATIVGLQEVYFGFISEIQKAYPDYTVFAPLGSFTKRTLVTLTLVKSNYIKSAYVIDSPQNCKLRNRLSIVRIIDTENNELTIINTYCVCHTGPSNKHYDRVSLSCNLWDTIKQAIVANPGSTVLLGDLQEDSESLNCKMLHDELGFSELAKNIPTVYNEYFSDKPMCIDHIFMNQEFLKSFTPKAFEFQGEFRGTLSDHSFLVLHADKK